MTQKNYNATSHFLSQRPIDMPFLAGGYTMTDWYLISGRLVNHEYMDDYLAYPDEKSAYINKWTKPYWA